MSQLGVYGAVIGLTGFLVVIFGLLLNTGPAFLMVVIGGSAAGAGFLAFLFGIIDARLMEIRDRLPKP